jgi:hypothetical protein
MVHVALPGRTPPYVLAYVNLDDGPRVLAHVTGVSQRLAVGARVSLQLPDEGGDVTVAAAGPG